mgnify:CR=1 FL=1
MMYIHLNHQFAAQIIVDSTVKIYIALNEKTKVNAYLLINAEVHH